MNRRQVLGGALAVALGTRVQAQTDKKVKIVELEQLKELWDKHAFVYQGEDCVLLRVPAPSKPTPRVVEHQKMFYSAYSRICTHSGCALELPNGLRQLECGCHGSIFAAADGTAEFGPASKPLRGIKLEIADGNVYALGWLEHEQ
ncbi:MAG: ubiquinol-cytochrome c reductase iron-sulfur subunit [Deinococcales bacterium]